mmetsp:Transcript_21669/g.49913  ORF Transcript_21669/g.49913 Transcript_21669/m.49913 type:complete len:117 (-) Transcript_21669:54-404(-)
MASATGYVNKVGEEVPSTVTDAVLVQSESLEDRPEHPPVRGVDWDNGQPTLDSMMAAFMTTGFQATEVGRAIEEINRMRAWRLSDEPIKESGVGATPDDMKDPEVRKNTKAKIFLR